MRYRLQYRSETERRIWMVVALGTYLLCIPLARLLDVNWIIGAIVSAPLAVLAGLAAVRLWRLRPLSRRS